MQKRKRMTGEERKGKILAAALELFAERGFAGTSTRELAARAGITEPVIYLHFRGKEDLLREVFRRQSFLPHLKEFAAVDSPASLREQLLALGHRWRRFMRERHHLVLLVFREMHHAPEMGRIFRDTLREGLALAVQGMRAHTDLAGFRSERLEAAMRLFFSSLMGHFLMEGPAFLEDDPRMEALLAGVVDLLVDGMRTASGEPA